MKYIDVKYYYIYEICSKNYINTYYIPIKEQVVNILTKSFLYIKHTKALKMLIFTLLLHNFTCEH